MHARGIAQVAFLRVDLFVLRRAAEEINVRRDAWVGDGERGERDDVRAARGEGLEEGEAERGEAALEY
jgi:hypothetical protein